MRRTSCPTTLTGAVVTNAYSPRWPAAYADAPASLGGHSSASTTHLIVYAERATSGWFDRWAGDGSPDPIYEIADDYLAFWFGVLRDDADLIEGGQGAAIQLRSQGRWQTHVARVFEAAVRDHVQRQVAAGTLPADTIVGRWWRDETAEVDVLGLATSGPVLLGECRWQAKPVTERDLAALRRKAAYLPPATSAMTYAFWSRGGIDPALANHPDVRSFTPADILLTSDPG
jgi:hypothetical protein